MKSIIIIIIIKITIILIYRVAKPLAVARHVMENSPHSILVGQGAQEYAVKNGFPVEPNSELIRTYQVSKFPTILFVKRGKIVNKIEGIASSQKLIEDIEKLIKNDPTN